MTSTAPPRVSVFIPVYNREAYVGAAIESVLRQSFQDFEILLIDDGSTDLSVEVLRSYDDRRIRVVRNERNLGQPETRNRGLALARGQYIAMLDSDDVARPDRLSRQVAFLDRHQDCVEVGGWTRSMDEAGHLLKKTKRQPPAPDDVHAQLLFRCSLSHTTIMGRTDVLRKYRYRKSFLRCQDYDLHVRLARHHAIANIPHILTHVRVHPGQIAVQTPGLGYAKKIEIIRAQLSALGINGSRDDLEAHLMLSRMRKLKFRPDRGYLDWAEAWLLELEAANRKTRCYSERSFARATSEKWLQTCWAASPNVGWTAWRRFLRSPLRRGIGSRLKREVHAGL